MGGGGFSSFQTFSSGGGPSQSIKTQTFIENGKRITRTEKTIVDSQGRKTTEVTDEIDEGNGRRQKQTYQLTNGQSGSSSKQGGAKQIRHK
ncbi:hypothetical protein FGO68_gene2142 [Halteria grandinella]|uniref:Uncharacterized protein n=1 Tax=Halteria grandinella TaxID=5974 RepID=A0A8J8NML3_HALGN|nr:hypothetical protein FGO68_gene2142 [Halteria grandinella]